MYEKFHDFNIIKGFCELHGSAVHVKPNVRLGVQEKKMSTNHQGGKFESFPNWRGCGFMDSNFNENETKPL